jgi:methionyl-tRNA formyltransferase
VPTVYLGTSDFAGAVLRRLAATQHRPALVVSRPDAPSGRGRHLTPPPVVEIARELELEVFQPQSVNDPAAVERIVASGAQQAIVCAFGALIKEPLLSAYEILNVHPSLLPRWRGAAPIERAIIAGDEITGVSIMRLTAGLDSGPVCLQEQVPIRGHENYGDVAKKLEWLSGELLLQALDGHWEFVEQSEDGVTYADKITAADRLLDPLAETAVELDRRVRGLSPHIGAYLEADGTRLGVSQAAVSVEKPGPGAGALDAASGRLLLGCREGVLELLTVQPPGKRPMPAADYLRGQRP